MDININFHIPFSFTEMALGISIVFTFLLALKVWSSNPKHPVNVYYSLATLADALWISSVLLYRTTDSPFLISLGLRFSYILPVFIALFFYLFCYYFPYKTTKFPYKVFLPLLFVSVFVIIVYMLPNVVVKGDILPENRLTPGNNRIGNFIYIFYFLSAMFISFYNLSKKYTQSDGIWRVRLRQVIVATAVAMGGGMTFNLILPIFMNRYIYEGYIGPFFTLFMAAYIWYHIFWKSHRMPKK